LVHESQEYATGFHKCINNPQKRNIMTSAPEGFQTSAYGRVRERRDYMRTCFGGATEKIHNLKKEKKKKALIEMGGKKGIERFTQRVR